MGLTTLAILTKALEVGWGQLRKATAKKKRQMGANRGGSDGNGSNSTSVHGSNIDMPRHNHEASAKTKRRILLDEDDPFADVPVDEDDMELSMMRRIWTTGRS